MRLLERISFRVLNRVRGLVMLGRGLGVKNLVVYLGVIGVF